MKNTAILMIHGFMGSPKEFSKLIEFLEEKTKYDIFTFTLPGHSKEDDPKQFKQELWLEAAEKELLKLIKLKYKHIYLLSHSMGGVLACDLASKYQEVEKLVLLAPAFSFMGFSHKYLKYFKTTTKFSKIYSFFRRDPLVKRMLGVPKHLQAEYLDLISSKQEVLKNVNAKVLQITGSKDKLVTKKDAKYVFNNIASKDKELVNYKAAGHKALSSADADAIHEKILEFFKS